MRAEEAPPGVSLVLTFLYSDEMSLLVNFHFHHILLLKCERRSSRESVVTAVRWRVNKTSRSPSVSLRPDVFTAFTTFGQTHPSNICIMLLKIPPEAVEFPMSLCSSRPALNTDDYSRSGGACEWVFPLSEVMICHV